MIIKQIKEEDLEFARDLYCDCFCKEKKDISLPIMGYLLGLYLDNELIGMAQIDFIHLIFENKKIAYVNSFCIKNIYQNQGYGTKLLYYCLSFAKENNANVIQLTSNSNRIFAQKLYKKLGFQKIDTNFYQKII